MAARRLAALLLPRLLLWHVLYLLSLPAYAQTANFTTCSPLLPTPFPSPLPVSSSSRLQGGQLSARLPFLAALHSTSTAFQCTAIVISSTKLLTAARCAQRLTDSTFANIAGARRINGIRIAVESIQSHPSYSNQPGVFDVALVSLKSQIPNAVPLPISEDKSLPSPKDVVRVLGFGASADAPSIDRGRPRSLDLVSAKCNRAVCLGRGSTRCRTCRGDSGAPVIMFDNEEQPVLVGVVSNSSVACTDITAKSAFVYSTRAADIVEWLRDSGIQITTPQRPVVQQKSDEEVNLESANAASDNDDDEGGLSTGAIVTIVVVAVLFLVGIPLIICLFIRFSGLKQVRALKRENADLAESGLVGATPETRSAHGG